MYGHLNFKILSMLNIKKMVHCIPYINEPNQICDACCRAKKARSSFKHDLPMKLKKKLELVHSNVCGHFEVRSNEGNVYFITFMDEFIRHVWVYLIERNSEVLEGVKNT